MKVMVSMLRWKGKGKGGYQEGVMQTARGGYQEVLMPLELNQEVYRETREISKVSNKRARSYRIYKEAVKKLWSIFLEKSWRPHGKEGCSGHLGCAPRGEDAGVGDKSPERESLP